MLYHSICSKNFFICLGFHYQKERRYDRISINMRDTPASCRPCPSVNSEALRRFTMRAVITVVGKDMVGILSSVSNKCARNQVNIIEVSQSILQEMFCMIMLVDVSKCSVPFTAFVEELETMGNEMNLSIHVMHEDIFNSMHRI